MLEDKEVDIVVLEPSKTGVDPSVIDTIINNSIKKVIYVSSNLVSMAKDLDKLSNAYNINAITPIDMLPQTTGVECVCTLTLSKK